VDHLSVIFAQLLFMRLMGQRKTYADMLESLLYVLWVVGRDRIGFESSPSAWTSVVGRQGCMSS
jgi:hypothetical protein